MKSTRGGTCIYLFNTHIGTIKDSSDRICNRHHDNFPITAISALLSIEHTRESVMLSHMSEGKISISMPQDHTQEGEGHRN